MATLKRELFCTIFRRSRAKCSFCAIHGLHETFKERNRAYNSESPVPTLLTLFSSRTFFGQVQNFFFRKFIASFVFMLEKYIKRPFFFLEKTLNFFSYRSEKTGKSSQTFKSLINLDLEILECVGFNSLGTG